MSESVLYRQIAAEIKDDILEGRLKRGDRLPSIRELSQKWKCTSGTIQRAFAELAETGLIISHAGKGTHVAEGPELHPSEKGSPLWMANLVHQAEDFLLESITTGYTPEEVRKALDLAMDRWRSIKPLLMKHELGRTIRFSGSHDQVINWLAANITKISAESEMEVIFNGSLNGLLHLAEDKADVAGCHLLDMETNQYNLPFISKLFPGKPMALIHLAKRSLGFILQPGNPNGIYFFDDLTKPELRMINRQSGSGTRVWFDASLVKYGLKGEQIAGYADEVSTHTDVARQVAENKVDFGIGLQSAAASYGLEFIKLTEENYDLVCYQTSLDNDVIKDLVDWFKNSMKDELSQELIGYDFTNTGTITLVSP